MSGQTHFMPFRVADGVSLPLSITLVWTDAPATPGANPALVNNLDLKLVTPSDYYFVIGFNAQGASSLNPTSPDAINNVGTASLNSFSGSIVLKSSGLISLLVFNPLLLRIPEMSFLEASLNSPSIDEKLTLKGSRLPRRTSWF